MKARRPIRVLVAEDDPVVREALCALVRAEDGLELAAEVADAPGAVEAAGRERPDVALIDVRMPGGGASAARGIRRRSPRTRVIAISSHDDRPTVLAMLEAGVVGYLVKGTSSAALVDSIRQAAVGQGSLSVEVTGDVISELVGALNVRRRAEKRQLSRERRVRRALDDESVLRMVFQPICELSSGRPAGVEALARFNGSADWTTERWFAEASAVGLRAELELAAVARALKSLPQLPRNVYLSVNASPRTIGAASFRKLLGDAGGSRVVVEVTEHIPVDDYGRLNDALAPVRELGARLAIDDAGAGFASLRHILGLAPDFIKLDRTLIEGIERDRSRQALAVGLISFAEKINATIVAEGVERPSEVDALSKLGVRYGQGYAFGRPGALDAAPVRRLRNGQPRFTRDSDPPGWRYGVTSMSARDPGARL